LGRAQQCWMPGTRHILHWQRQNMAGMAIPP
jgi:hypothetical protein